MDEQPKSEPEPADERAHVWGRAAAEAAASAGGTVVGLAFAGSAGAVMGAVVPPVTMALFDEFGARHERRRRERALRVLGAAAAEMGTTVDDVIEAASDPQRELLLGQAIMAGSNTALDAKVVALGRALGVGLAADDDAVLDETALILAALADMEVPHIRVLARFCREPKVDRVRVLKDGSRVTYKDYKRPVLDLPAVTRALPQYRFGVEGLMGTLARHGLIVEQPIDLERAFKAFSSQKPGRPFLPSEITRGGKVLWQATALGTGLFEYVNAASAATADNGNG